MTEIKDSTLRKIAALLAKAEDERGASEAERDAAMAKATELMSKHNIDYAQLNAGKQSAPGDVADDTIDINGAMNQWQRYLYNSIAKPSFVKVIYQKTGKNSMKIWLFGRPDNIAFVRTLANFLIPWLEGECKHESKRLQLEAQETGEFFNPRAFKRSFMEAASSRIYTRLVTLRKDTGTPHALVTNEEAANQKAVERTFGRVRHTRSRGSGQADGHAAGRRAGDRADLSPGKKLNA